MSSSAAVWPVVGLLVGDVFVDPLGSVSCLIEGHGADGDQERDDGRGEDRVDEGPRGRGHQRRVRSRTSGFSVKAITLAVRKRKRTWPSVLASRNARTKNGQADELDPPRIWIVGPEPAMDGCYRRGRAGLGRSGQRYGPANGDSALTSRRAASCGPAARAGASRWFAIAVVVGILGVATLALTAFDGSSSSASAPSVPPLPVTSAPPEPQVLATVGNLRVQSPVAQGGVTAVGFHGAADGALVLQPRRPTVERRAARAALAPHHRIVAARPGVVPARERHAPHARCGRGRRHRRLLAGRRNGRRHPRPRRLGAHGRSRDRTSTHVGTVPRRCHRERQARPRAQRRERTSPPGSSKLGTVTDISRYEQQALRRYATDGGNNVSIRVYPSATLGVP